MALLERKKKVDKQQGLVYNKNKIWPAFQKGAQSERKVIPMVTKIATEKAPGAIGPYSQGVVAGNLVYTSVQIPVNPETGAVEECVKAQTKQSLENVKAVLAEAGCTMEDVFKTTVFIKDMNDFAAINEVYATYFTGDVLPARSCVEVARLPKDVKVEIEVIAMKK